MFLILFRFYCSSFWTIGVFSFIILSLFTGCSTYRSFGTREFSWQLNAPKSNNPIFVEAYDHDFLWTVLVDVIDSHFEIEREIPIRLYGNVLTESRLDTEPKIGASIVELWHADSVGLSERIDSTLQTIRRRVEVHAIPEVGGYLIDVKVYKELEDNKNPLKSNSSANLRFEDEIDSFATQIEVDSGSGNWFIVERDTAMEDRLLLEIMYRLKHPSGIIRKSKEPIRG